MRYLLSAILFSMVFTSVAHAQATQDYLVVTNAWSRATPSADATAVIYLTVTDKGTPDLLMGASTPIAAMASLHESQMRNGVMHMRTANALPVDSDHPLQLAPAGYHLMLMGLKMALKAGTTFPLMLTFAKAGTVTTTVVVENSNATKSVPMPEMDMRP